MAAACEILCVFGNGSQRSRAARERRLQSGSAAQGQPPPHVAESGDQHLDIGLAVQR
jgi:hypothetical protein